jgi:hypothetical protein
MQNYSNDAAKLLFEL